MNLRSAATVNVRTQEAIEVTSKVNLDPKPYTLNRPSVQRVWTLVRTGGGSPIRSAHPAQGGPEPARATLSTLLSVEACPRGQAQARD